MLCRSFLLLFVFFQFFSHFLAAGEAQEALYIRRLAALKEKGENSLFEQQAVSFIQEHPHSGYLPYVRLMMAEEALDCAREKEAFGLFSQLMDSPLKEKAINGKLLIWRKNGQWTEIEKALEQYKHLISKNLKESLYFEAAVFYLEDKQKALKLLTRASRLKGDLQFEINILLTAVYDQLGHSEQAYAFFFSYVKNHPEFLKKEDKRAKQALILLSQLAFKIGKLEEAQGYMARIGEPYSAQAIDLSLLLAKNDLRTQDFSSVLQRLVVCLERGSAAQKEYGVYLQSEALNALEVLKEPQEIVDPQKQAEKERLLHARMESSLEELEEIASCKIFLHEPNHLESAIDLFLLKKEDRVAYEWLLNKKEDFLREDDIPSKEYHEERRVTVENENLFQSYLLLIDGYLALLESRMAQERAEQARKEKRAEKIFNALLQDREFLTDYIIEHVERVKNQNSL